MNRTIVMVVVLIACRSADDIAALHDEAVALGSYYQPRLDAFEGRLRDLTTRGPRLGGHKVPGNELADRWRKLAADQLAELASTTAALTSQADELARSGDLVHLRRLVADTTEKLERGSA